MIYIIDANNLAGKLEILFEDDFDKKMVALMKKYFFNKGIDVKLVFDSNDIMGDKFQEDNVEVVYTPRDNYYANADDKVLELVKREISHGVGNGQITVVTDDLDLRALVQSFADKTNFRLNLVRSTDFAARIRARENKENYDEADRGLSVSEEERINEELLGLWGGK